jgi:XTP/dITP diphosphohydrolase
VTMRAVLATGNAGKAAEYARLLGADVEAVALDVAEDGETFAENARLKARAAHGVAGGRWALGDDSGLAVEALDGAPGVRSARFAGPDDDARNRRLLELLAGETHRDAAFVCALAAVAPDGRELVVEGVLEGAIAERCAGEAGFGYDPLFVPRGERRTLAQLGPQVKDAISHRARAARALRAALSSERGRAG